MIKRYCSKKTITKVDIDIVGALMVAVHGLLNNASGARAICDYPDSGTALLYLFLLNDNSLADEAASKLMFLITNGHNEESIDLWVDNYSKEHGDHLKLESLIAVFEQTNEPFVVLSFMKVMNVFISCHVSLYKRMNVASIQHVTCSSEASS